MEDTFSLVLSFFYPPLLFFSFVLFSCCLFFWQEFGSAEQDGATQMAPLIVVFFSLIRGQKVFFFVLSVSFLLLALFLFLIIPLFRQEVGNSDWLTAGLLFLETHANNQFAKQPEGLRHFRDHRWKALGEENPNPPRRILSF